MVPFTFSIPLAVLGIDGSWNRVMGFKPQHACQSLAEGQGLGKFLLTVVGTVSGHLS